MPLLADHEVSAFSLQGHGESDQLVLSGERAKFNNQSTVSVEYGALHWSQVSIKRRHITLTLFPLITSHWWATYWTGNPHRYIIVHWNAQLMLVSLLVCTLGWVLGVHCFQLYSRVTQKSYAVRQMLCAYLPPPRNPASFITWQFAQSSQATQLRW